MKIFFFALAGQSGGGWAANRLGFARSLSTPRSPTPATLSPTPSALPSAIHCDTGLITEEIAY